MHSSTAQSPSTGSSSRRHLDTSAGFRCRIYAVRPKVCRDYSCIRDGKIVSSAVALRVQAAIDAGTRAAA